MAKVYKAQTYGTEHIVVEITCEESEIDSLPTCEDDGVKRCCNYKKFGPGSAAVTDTGKVFVLFEDNGWVEL